MRNHHLEVRRGSELYLPSRCVNIVWTGKLNRFLDAQAFYARPIIML